MKPVAELPTLATIAPVLRSTAEPASSRRCRATPIRRSASTARAASGSPIARSSAPATARHPGSYWLTFARRLDGDTWTEPIEVHHSDGLLDHRPVLLPHPAGGLLVIHNTDGRYTTPETIDNQIYMSYVDLPGEPVEPKLVPHDPGKKDPKLVERARTKRRRQAHPRLPHRGRRQEAISSCAASSTATPRSPGTAGPTARWKTCSATPSTPPRMDWIGNGDHDNGAGREYSWWLIAEVHRRLPRQGPLHADVHLRAQRRLSARPSQLHVRPARRPHAAAAGRAGHGKKRVGRRPRRRHQDALPLPAASSTASAPAHTSATSMGTDWRDNDPVVEPIVEIYQGDRMSYEMEGAPRAGYDPQDRQEARQHRRLVSQGLHQPRPARRATASASRPRATTGPRTSPTASSWPRGTTAQAILDAIKKRHCYARHRQHHPRRPQRRPHHGRRVQDRRGRRRCRSRVIGTAPLAKIEILKDSEVVAHVRSPARPEFHGELDRPEADGGRPLLLRPRAADRRRAGLGLADVDGAGEVITYSVSK